VKNMYWIKLDACSFMRLNVSMRVAAQDWVILMLPRDTEDGNMPRPINAYKPKRIKRRNGDKVYGAHVE